MVYVYVGWELDWRWFCVKDLVTFDNQFDNTRQIGIWLNCLNNYFKILREDRDY